jgi:hypothetical protein
MKFCTFIDFQRTYIHWINKCSKMFCRRECLTINFRPFKRTQKYNWVRMLIYAIRRTIEYFINIKKRVITYTCTFDQGCQIVRGKYTKLLQNTCTKRPRNVRKMTQLSIKYTSIFHCKTLRNLPKLGVLVWKYTIWQPCFWRMHLRYKKWLDL